MEEGEEFWEQEKARRGNGGGGGGSAERLGEFSKAMGEFARVTNKSAR